LQEVKLVLAFIPHFFLFVLFQFYFLYKSVEVRVPIPSPGSFVRHLDAVKDTYLGMWQWRLPTEGPFPKICCCGYIESFCWI